MAQDATLHQIIQKLRGVRNVTKMLAILKWQLIGSAFHVREQYIEVVGLQQGMLRTLRQKILRMIDDILINCGRGGDHDSKRRIFSPAGASGLLPGAGDGTWIAA